MKIITERFIIRPMTMADNVAMQQILCDFENSPAKAYDFPRPTDADKINLLMRYWVRSGKYFMTEEKNTGAVVGFLCFEDNEIGFSILSEHQGKGCGYETASAFIDYLHTQKRKNKITAQAAMENKPSVKLLEKLGFVLESTENISFRRDESGKGIPCVLGNFSLKL